MSDWLWSQVLNWLPLVVVLVAYLFVTKISSRHMDSVQKINDDILEITRQNNSILTDQIVVLREIKTLLEDRKS